MTNTQYFSVPLWAATVFLSAAFIPAAYAQVPPSAAPEHIEQRFNPPVVEPEEGQPSTVVVPKTPKAHMAKGLAKSFVLQSVEIKDVTVYPQGTFDSLYAGKIGQTISLDQAGEIARAISTRYRADGYVLSQAIIPEQDLEKGVLHITVVEGFVDQVYVENAHPDVDKRNLIAAYGRKISGERPLNTKTIERYMLLVNDLPGIQGRAILRPSPNTYGAADLVIQVNSKVVDASFTSDNRGNKFLGPYQEQLTATENSALGLGERTTVRGINTIPTQELHYLDIQHEEQIGTEGTRLIAFAGFARTHPGDILKPLDFRGSSDDFSLTVTHPFLRSRAQNFTGRAIFDARDTENDSLGIRLSNDRVRAVRIGGNYNTSDKFNGVDLFDGQVSQGVSWLNATSDGLGRSRTVGDQLFTKFNADISRLQNFTHGFSLLTAVTGQYSGDPLLTSEQMVLGGLGFGQAYDAGELSGDSGLAGKIELRWGDPVGKTWFDSYQLYTYYDVGSVYINQNAPGTDSTLSLASLGAGIRANFTSNLYGYLEVAQPLTRTIASEGNKDPRLFFSVTARF